MRRIRTGWGIGTIFTLIIVFFVYLYARDHAATHWGWKVLQYVAGAYLLISIGLLALMIILPIIIVLIALMAARRHRKRGHKVIDVEALEEKK